MGLRGPKPVSPTELYFFAQDFYWAFRGLAEGQSHWGFDKQHYHQEKQAVAEKGIKFSDETERAVFARKEEQIRTARLTEAEKQERLRRLQRDQEWDIELRRLDLAQERSRKKFSEPGKPEVLKALMGAKTPGRVREICQDAFTLREIEVFDPITSKLVGYRDVEVRNWPIASGSVFPQYLAQHAEQFIAAKDDPRFPRSNRPTNQLKQFWFLSRALAGAVLGVQTRTAINLVGSKRPEQIFEESRAAKWERVRTKRNRRSQ